MVGRLTGRIFGDPENPLLVSVRSGARASMPGMMDTVLNLGLNDVTVEAVAKDAGDGRFAYDSYRRFITMYANVVLGVEHHHFEAALEDLQGAQGPIRLDTDLSADDWKILIGTLQGHRRKGTRQGLPAGSAGAALGRHRRSVRLMDECPRHQVPRAARHPGELGHGGERPGDGVRQHGRHVRDRRRLHAQSVDRRERALRRVPHQRAGRGRRRRHPHAAGHHREGASGFGIATSPRWKRAMPEAYASCAGSTASSRNTTATCRTWSSRSRRASSGCCRPATASAPRRLRCASRSNSRARV